MKATQKYSMRDFLDYEIRSSWWASSISWNWAQDLAGRYFAWKVKRKYSRYVISKIHQQFLINNLFE